jgi:TRAP-type C4-dicarboxylate transport system permease large subunit
LDQELLLAFAAAGMFIAAFHAMRLRHDSQDHRTLQEAIRADSPIVQDLFDQLRDRPRRRSQTTGMVLIALAIAIVGAGVIQGGEQNIRSAAAAALFPALLGAVVYWRSLKRPGG